MDNHSEVFFSTLKSSVIHGWLVDIDGMYPKESIYYRYLSQEEKERANGYRFEYDRTLFINRRIILRQLLGHYTHTKPSNLEFQTNPYGKRSLFSQKIRFNTSCCQNKALFVFVQNKEIGVDIERVNFLADLESLVSKYFSLQERAEFFALPREIRLDAFFHIWTQKEAFVKSQGWGISFPLQDFSVSVDPQKPGELLSMNNCAEDLSQWKFICTIPEPGWRVAVCVHSETKHQIQWRYEDLEEVISLTA